MTNEIHIAPTAALAPQNSVPATKKSIQAQESPPSTVVLSPGEWIRAVSKVEAPFGFDRMPTVWG